MMIYDVIIIGKGPAGLSAAVYAVRSGLRVLVLGRDTGALQKADKIENYLGFTDPVSGSELVEASTRQAERLGTEIISTEVTGISWQDQFTVHTTKESYQGLTLVLATGMPRKKASVKGLTAYEGRGVSYCATCDGFFYRGKTVAVIGDGDYAFREASELKPFAAKIHLLTNGRPYQGAERDDAIEIDERPVVGLQGEDKVESLTFGDGNQLSVDGVFVAEGTASALDLALKLGLENDGRAITVEPYTQATNLPGVFAAGDCTGGLLQIAVAVGEGAQAGMSAAAFVKTARGEKTKRVQWGE
ncbi:MAG: NAD(P)/FAD-dependent oxidoreductase [Eubacteriales bacterium]|nr:NAD(P)/FAD-dependent oxidoreductase [Eubacteriales bacterium]MDD3866516.1 NAD(P)/FAD-dependent oxidoreductase [Eubacteriales bacterium]MDD4460705.1 NAD(P)/FAD-dependent oxidoreductase [Eubacteriales bacterium]